MTRVQWNGLRVGDHVLVHDEDDPGMALVPGRVTAVEPGSGSNTVAIRIKPTTGTMKIVQPSRMMVHDEDLDPDGHCWRCDNIALSVRAIAK